MGYSTDARPIRFNLHPRRKNLQRLIEIIILVAVSAAASRTRARFELFRNSFQISRWFAVIVSRFAIRRVLVSERNEKAVNHRPATTPD
jgi:hypothetical protein